MSDDRYDKLKKRYDALLEENEYLKAKIRKLESQQDLISICHETNPMQDTLFHQNSELVSIYNSKMLQSSGTNSKERYAWIAKHLSNAAEEAVKVRQANT